MFLCLQSHFLIKYEQLLLSKTLLVHVQDICFPGQFWLFGKILSQLECSCVTFLSVGGTKIHILIKKVIFPLEFTPCFCHGNQNCGLLNDKNQKNSAKNISRMICDCRPNSAHTRGPDEKWQCCIIARSGWHPNATRGKLSNDSIMHLGREEKTLTWNSDTSQIPRL